jgi:head-tail adaptor
VSDWPLIDPGDLRHLVQINKQSATQDSFGQPVLSWTTFRTPMAGLNLLSLKEAFGDGQLTAQESDIWTMRWTPDEVQPGMQLVFGANAYEIQAVNNVMRRNVLLHLLCLQLNAQS